MRCYNIFKSTSRKVDTHGNKQTQQQKHNARKKTTEQILTMLFFCAGKIMLIRAYVHTRLVLICKLILFLRKLRCCYRSIKVGKRNARFTRTRITRTRFTKARVIFRVSRFKSFVETNAFNRCKLCGEPCHKIVQKRIVRHSADILTHRIMKRNTKYGIFACVVIAQIEHQPYLTHHAQVTRFYR